MNKPVNAAQLSAFEAFAIEARYNAKKHGQTLTSEHIQDMWANLPEPSTESPKGSPHNPDRDTDNRHSWSGRGK